MIPEDKCEYCGEDCTWSEGLTWYHVKDGPVLSFCDLDCLDAWKEREK